MRIFITVLSLFLTSFLAVVKGQTKSLNPSFISIDHIPIVVKDLDSTSRLFSNTLQFKIKNGREHEGIKNCFVKFQDGTYLEFTMPIDSSKAIGKYYADALIKRQGGTALAVSVKSADTIIKYLETQSLPFEISNNSIWKTVSSKEINLFFIEYSNKEWKDTKENTAHSNTALSLKSVYLLSNNLNTDINKYNQHGVKKANNGSFLNIPYVKLTIGKSNLYLLDASRANKLSSKFKSDDLNGICGFEIAVSSLATINSLLSQTEGVLFESKKTICFLESYNFFLIFSE